MERKYHARCDYCGATEGTDWRKRQFKIYCSADCQWAGELWIWSSFLVIMGSIIVVWWLQAGVVEFMIPFLFLFLIFACPLVIPIIWGFQAMGRIAQRSKPDGNLL